VTALTRAEPVAPPARSAGDAVLELRDVRRSFGAVEAVRGVSERFERGEYVCILGPSGCGKTTLLRMVAGFEEPSSGELFLDGRRLNGLPPERRDVNIVFQSYALFPHLSVADNVAFGLRMKKLPREEVRRRVGEALALVRLDGLDRRAPRELSGGQQQRVALARALVNRPRVLLLDEPLSALDRSLRLAMQEELRRLQRETGVTFLHITHDQVEALTMADRLAVMREGRFVQVGPPREVYHRPAGRFVAAFLGSANLLDGVLREGGVVELAGGRRLRATPPAAPAAPPPPGSRVTLCVRPEAVELASTGGAARDATGFPGIVTEVVFAGPVVECRVEAGPLRLDAHVPNRAGEPAPRAGQEVTVHVRPEDAVILPEEPS
jgi:spermidine/putrescine transport system ATP-binding protein